jgi:hypothetical protein
MEPRTVNCGILIYEIGIGEIYAKILKGEDHDFGKDMTIHRYLLPKMY